MHTSVYLCLPTTEVFFNEKYNAKFEIQLRSNPLKNSTFRF